MKDFNCGFCSDTGKVNGISSIWPEKEIRCPRCGGNSTEETERDQTMPRQKLFTKEIESKLQAQFHMGSSFEQKVIAKIYNPYGRGTWYLINQDPNDPDYLWAIVDLHAVEMGSVSKSELEECLIPVAGFKFPLERDKFFKEVTVKELWDQLNKG